MKTVNVNYDAVHAIVDNNKNAYWDGWTAVFIRPNKNAYTQKRAVFLNGCWNTVLLRSFPDKDGNWKVPVNV